MWLNTDTISDNNRILSNTDNYNFSVKFNGSGGIEVYGPTEGWGGAVVSGLSVDNQWFHLCLVFDGAGNVTGYKNGTLGSTQTTTANRSNLGLAAKVGLAYGTNYNGTMDEVALFNTALTQSQVQALADSKDSPINPMALPTKPIAYYPLGEQARVGGNSNPNAGSSEWQFPNQSIQSTAVNFAASDYISTSHISLSSAFSVSAWVNTTDTNTYGNIFSSDQAPIGGAIRNWQLIRFNATARFILRDSSGSAIADAYDSSVVINDGKWHHVLVTWDGTTGTNKVKVHIDGNLAAQDTASSTALRNDSVLMIMGGSSVTWDLIGKLSNVAVWNSDQSSEKDNIYNNGTPASSYTNTPIAWWKLNAANSSYNTSNSTWTFTDSAGSNNGTSTTLPTSALVRSDLQFESPYSNFSLDFDGSTNYLNTNQSLDSSYTALTLSAWVNYTSLSSYTGTIFGQWIQNNFQSPGSTIICYTVSNKIQVYLGPSASSLTSTTVLSTGTWYNVILRFDGSTMKLYINGTEEASVSFTAINNSAQNLILGAYSNSGQTGYQSHLNGKLDEVAIWNTALTTAQINQIYNSGLAADLTSLSPSNWWRLGEDAYFVNNNITIPNQIAGGPSGTGSGTQTSMLVADAPGSYGSGSGVNLDIVDRIGEAPGTSPINVGNSQSYNMIPDNRHSYVPGYTPATVDNAASMDFDGVNDYFDLGSGLDYFDHENGSYSVSCWTKWTVTSWTKPILNFGANNFKFGLWGAPGSATQGTGNGMSISTAKGGAPRLGVYNWYHPTIVLNDGEWHHICVVVYKSATSIPTYNIYIDADSSGSGAGTSFTYAANNTISGSTKFFAGSVDELAIFNYALTPKQIKEDIYNASKPISGDKKTADLNNNSNLTAPVAWYRMGD
jgi:hypothetical protein